MVKSIIFSFILFIISFQSEAQEAKKNAGEFFYPAIQNGWYGYINYSGDMVIPPVFQWAGYFYNGLAVVQKNKKYGFINPKGEWVIQAEFDSARRFSEGLAAVTALGNDSILYWSYIDTSGKVLEINLPGICTVTDFHDNRALVHLCDGNFSDYYFIDRTGKTIFTPDSYYIDDSRPAGFSEGYMRVVLPDNSRTFIDTAGKLWNKGTFQDVGDFKEGLAWFSENGQYGFIDKQGKIIIPAKFEAVSDFSEGLAKTTERQEYDNENMKLTGGLTGYLNKEGKYIVSPQYKEGGDYHDGFVLVKLGDYYGFLDKTGSAVINFQYKEAKSFFRGLANVKLENRWEYINTSGKKVW